VSVLNAAQAVFGPLARLLVEHGISSPEAESLLRAVFVHQAARTECFRAKKPNASRIALVTGVDRAEVARILEGTSKVDPTRETRRHRANNVLAGWYSDRDFLGQNRPLLLAVKSRERSRSSFWTLASRYAPGVYPGLILSELCRVGAVKKLQDGRVRVRMRRYKAKEFSDESLGEMGSRTRDLLQTMVSNATQASWPRICRAVETLSIDQKYLPLIRKMLADRTEALLSGLQEELKSSRWRRTERASPRVRIGLTVFSHEEWPEEDKSNAPGEHTHPSSEPSLEPRPRSKSGPRNRRK